MAQKEVDQARDYSKEIRKAGRVQTATEIAACRQVMESGKQDDELKVVAATSKWIMANQAQLIMFVTSRLLAISGGILYCRLNDRILVIGVMGVSLGVAILGWKGLRR